MARRVSVRSRRKSSSKVKETGPPPARRKPKKSKARPTASSKGKVKETVLKSRTSGSPASRASRARSVKPAPRKARPPRPLRGPSSRGESSKGRRTPRELSRAFSKAMGGGALPIVAERSHATKRGSFERQLERLGVGERQRFKRELALRRSKREEKRYRDLADDLARRQVRRVKFHKTKGAKQKMKKALASLLKINRAAAKRLGLNRDAVRGYVYKDGRVTVRIAIPRKHKGKKVSIAEISEAIRGKRRELYPKGTFIEGNLLLNPQGKIGKRREEYTRHRGFIRLQMGGSRRQANALSNLEGVIQNMKRLGYKEPEEIYIRSSWTIDGSQPFLRKRRARQRR